MRANLASTNGAFGCWPCCARGVLVLAVVVLAVARGTVRADEPAQADGNTPSLLAPPALDRSQEDFVPLPELTPGEEFWPPLRWPIDPPLGYSGPSGIVPREEQTSSHFVPMEDRWRIGFPEWDRYDKGHPLNDEYPYAPGAWYDPYHQNVLKGDYPILGQHNFLNITVVENLILEARQVPTPTTPFESTIDPNSEEFFGDPDQFFLNNNVVVSFDWVHGNGAFKPPDWRLKLAPIFNVNHLVVDELAIVNPDVRRGTARGRFDFALEQWFFETKIADLSPDYDFLSLRLGSQPFVSDFRGFVFADVNRMIRLFGNRLANRDQFNVIYVDQTEKETNSLLNTFDDRHQNTLIVNYYRQDFIWPGYTAQLSYHYNRDEASFEFDENDSLVRPDPVGVFAPHEVNAHYLGWAGDGHINRLNISHAFYWVLGKDELNPIAGEPQNINAQMFALELSYDRDWMRFRSSYFLATGDSDVSFGNREATGFDTIFDNPAFAGGQFSYWNRQQIKLFGVNLVNRMSLVPDLRSSKFQGQANFVNPGLQLINLGVDADVTPKLKLISNVNFLWFNQTEVLETLVFQDDIKPFIGADLSLGIEHRPFLTNNVIVLAGISGLVPGDGFRDLYNPLVGKVETLVAGFVDIAVTY